MLKSNSYKIRKSLPGFMTFIKPAVKNSHDKGRPKGEMFIAVPDAIKNELKDISPVYWRTQAVIISIKNSKILVVNSYFPTDPGNAVIDESELLETLESIRLVIDTNEFNDIFWLGDINTDFLRRTGHVKYVKRFTEEFQFKHAWSRFHIDFTHYQEHRDNTHTSIVDHIF